MQLRRRKLPRSDSFKHVAAEKKIIRTGKSKQYFCKWYLSFLCVCGCVSIFYFSTCLQREADKKDLLGLFVAVGGRVTFVCGATRQMLQVKLPQRGQSYPEGASPGTKALLFLSLLFGGLLCCRTRSFMACRSGQGFIEQSTPSSAAAIA